MRRKKFKIIFLTFTLLLFLTCLSSIYASNDTSNAIVCKHSDSHAESVKEKNMKTDTKKISKLNVTVNKVKTNNYLTHTTITGKISTEDKKLPNNNNIHLYVNNKKQSKTNFTLSKNGTFKYTTKQKIGTHTFKIHINDTKYQTKKTTTKFTVTDKTFPLLNKSRPIYFAMDHTSRKDKQICNNIIKKLKQEGFKVARYKIGPNAMYQNMLYLYKNKIHNAIMFHLFNGVDPSNIREVAAYGPDNRGRIVRQRKNDAVLAWFYDASDPIHIGGNCYKSVRASETGSRLYNPKEYMDKNNIYSICTSSDHYKHKNTADYNGDKTTLEFMKLFTNDTNLKYQTKTSASISLTDDYLVTITGTVTYPTGSVNGYAKINDQNGNTITDNIPVKNNKFTTKFISKNVGKQKYTTIYKGSPLYSTSNKTVTTTINVKNATIKVKQEKKIIEDNNVHITLTEPNTRELLVNQPVKITYDKKTSKYYTDKNGSILANINVKKNQAIKISVYHDNKLLNTTTFKVKVYKENVNVKLETVKGIIGDKIQLKAHVTSTSQNPVNDGKIIFKINGKTLRKDNTVNSNKSLLKCKVINGIATYTLTADSYLNAKNIRATYEGTNRYKSNSSNTVKAVITKRSAKIYVSIKKVNKDKVTFTANIKDTRNSASLLSQNAYVSFNVNNVTLKDSSGKNIRVKVDKSGKAVYTYTRASDELCAKNSSYVSCEYVNDNYYPVSCTKKFRV